MALIVERLDRVVLVAGDLDRLARFYGALGFDVGEVRGAPDQAELAEAAAAASRTMWLGGQAVEFVAFDPPGAAYPRPARSDDPWFQHVALVAPDMGRAMESLRATPGFAPISRHGVAHLKPETGGVSAYKFRDPEGHPLEFLAFPAGRTPARWAAAGPGLLGYDHSAITVSNIAASIGFYTEELGMRLGPRTLNQDAAQEALDDVAGAVVDVVALMPATDTPHVELLGYRPSAPRPPTDVEASDQAATRLVLATRGLASPRLARVPDGHWLHLIPA